MRNARSKIKDLATGFRYHDLRHYFAGPFTAYRTKQAGFGQMSK